MAATRDIKSKRRLIIHCGVQKTASTSLHRFVQRNRGLLSSYLHILTPVKGSPVQQMGRAAMQFSLEPTPERLGDLKNLINGVRDQLLDGTTPVLISHENLPGAMIGKRSVVTLYPHLEQIITLLDAQLAPFVPEYVFYTREMTDWKTSVYNQAVKSDHYPHAQEMFDLETRGCGSWGDLERRMQTQVGDDRVRFFRVEDEVDRSKPGLQLLRHAGLDEKAIKALHPMDQAQNPSLNTGSLEFLRLVNRQDFDQGARRKIVDLVRTNQSLFVQGATP